MHAPTEQNFQALKRILHYLKGSSRRGLLFQKGNQKLSIYSDSDWANGKDDRRSTTRYLLFLGPNLISWCTKKQTRDIFDELWLSLRVVIFSKGLNFWKGCVLWYFQRIWTFERVVTFLRGCDFSDEQWIFWKVVTFFIRHNWHLFILLFVSYK